MSKVAANKLIKKNMLFQTAFELFREKGFAKTTISDIVKKAGLAKGTFISISKINMIFGTAW